MERSVSQLLSVRREHNCTKLDVEELKHLWDITVAFIQVRGEGVGSTRPRKVATDGPSLSGGHAFILLVLVLMMIRGSLYVHTFPPCPVV